jgi:hypothetical protein
MNKRLPDIPATLFIFIFALGLYLRTAAPGLVYEGGVSVDSAEIQRASYHLGIIHSTGYPIYTVLAFVVSRIGEALGQSPYTWITYFSALCTALALVVFFHAARLIAKPLPSLAVTLLLIVTNSIWQMSTFAEVQGFQALILAGFLWALLYYHLHPTQPKALYLASACIGIGIANHRLIVLVIPAFLVTLLLHYRDLKWKHLFIAAVCGILPILTYGYIYLRAADPFVVYSTRPAWTPQPISVQDATNIIRGTFAGSGSAGLETNFEFNPEAIMNRAPTIWQHLREDWDLPLIILSLIALMIYFAVNWRLALILTLLALPVVPFLLIWKVDVKPIIYQYALWFPLALALATLISMEELRGRGGDKLKSLSPKVLASIEHPANVVMVVMSVLMLIVAFAFLKDNFGKRDMSDDHRSETFTQDIAALPDNAMFASVQWAPDVFLTLDYLERSGRRFLVNNTDDWWAQLDAINNPAQEVYVGEYWRARVGLYDGATWLAHDFFLAYSGTHSEFLLQVRPANDPRLQPEADSATVVNHPMDDNISLYSYRLEPTDDGWHITLYWQAQTTPVESYSVYTHLRVYGVMCQFDSIVSLLAQDDSRAPVQGAYPTTLWSAGQIVKDTYFIPTPADSLDSAHTAFVFGMTRPTGERLNEFCLPLESSNE